jgi:hypothetical protein
MGYSNSGTLAVSREVLEEIGVVMGAKLLLEVKAGES